MPLWLLQRERPQRKSAIRRGDRPTLFPLLLLFPGNGEDLSLVYNDLDGAAHTPMARSAELAGGGFHHDSTLGLNFLRRYQVVRLMPSASQGLRAVIVVS
jgi:hypothetical protein